MTPATGAVVARSSLISTYFAFIFISLEVAAFECVKHHYTTLLPISNVQHCVGVVLIRSHASNSVLSIFEASSEAT